MSFRVCDAMVAVAEASLQSELLSGLFGSCPNVAPFAREMLAKINEAATVSSMHSPFF
jgi:hypothetical protein